MARRQRPLRGSRARYRRSSGHRRVARGPSLSTAGRPRSRRLPPHSKARWGHPAGLPVRDNVIRVKRGTGYPRRAGSGSGAALLVGAAVGGVALGARARQRHRSARGGKYRRDSKGRFA